MPASIRITKVRNVKTPARANPTDAGCDFWFPEDLKVEEFLTKGVNGKLKYFTDRSSVTGELINNVGDVVKHVVLEPGERVLIPSGVHVQFPHGYALIMHNKSGISTKKGLDVLANTVDADYQGEVHISLVNSSNTAVNIGAGEKIIQGILLPVVCAVIEEVSTLEELYPVKTTRNCNGFGSTGQF